MNISENDIKKICSAGVYKSGLSYFKEGRVHIRTRDEKRIVASVDSDKVYSVHIAFGDKDEISETFCTCPYYQTMNTNCKHIVATLKARQAELLEDGNFKDAGDALAAQLCREFEAIGTEKIHLPVSFVFNINTSLHQKCTYTMSVILGNGDSPISYVEDFLEAFATGKEYKLSKHKTYKNSLFEIGAFEEHILSLLAEACQNKISAGACYTKKITATDFGFCTAKRLFPLLSGVNCKFTLNGLAYHNVKFKNEDPDILVDVTATDENINVSVPQSGIALVPDGSWFFYDGDIYATSFSWRKWFMPIYKTLAIESRTQIDFRGTNLIAFASNILPHLRGKKGVILQGIENMIVDDKPEFDVYFDRYDDGITAAITATYGNITIRLPDDTDTRDKIIVRDIAEEKALMSLFCDFSKIGQSLYLDGDQDLYNFLSTTYKRLVRMANIHTSQSFDNMQIKALPKISQKASYNDKIDLLEVGFTSDLSASEIAAILSSIRHKKPFYRTKSGEFLDLLGEPSGFDILNNLNFSYSDLRDGKKTLSKYNVLYLMSALEGNKIEADNGFLKLIDEIKNIRADIPKELMGVMRDYQKTGVHWMRQITELGSGGILADDMGLGKTLEAISFIISQKSELPSLIITPSSVVYNWLAEINKFIPSAKTKIIDGTKEERISAICDLSGYDFVITSYPLLRRDIEEYSACAFSCCVLDEAQHIKNAKTAGAKAVKKIRAQKYFALTGTPMENSLSELWSIFDFIMPGYLGTHQQFRERYETPILKGDINAADSLKAKIKPFILRRMKSDVLSELPDKIESTYFAELDTQQKKIYSAFLHQAKKELKEDSTGKNQIQILALLMRLRQICCHPRLLNDSFTGISGKLTLLEELVKTSVKSGHRILIFSQFSSMLSIIQKTLLESGIDSFYLDGKTPSYDRIDMVDRFNGGEKSVFLVSLKAGGTGLNLIGADTVIHYDPWWNPASADQASDRAYRIGQTKAVHIINLVSKGTIEEQILKLQNKKRLLNNDIIKANTEALLSLTREEILELFK